MTACKRFAFAKIQLCASDVKCGKDLFDFGNNDNNYHH